MTNENLATQVRNREVHGSRIHYSEPNWKKKNALSVIQKQKNVKIPTLKIVNHTFKVADSFAMHVI